MVRIATWTAPRTWVSGEIVTAANMNTHVRDNLTTMTQAWTAYTPTWSGTIGNGTLAGTYQRVGITVHWRASVTWGSSTTHPAATQTISLPVAAHANYTTYGAMGAQNVSDFSSGGFWSGVVVMAAASTTIVFGGGLTSLVTGSSTTFPTNLVPMTWATSDVWFLTGTYEAATL